MIPRLVGLRIGEADASDVKREQNRDGIDRGGENRSCDFARACVPPDAIFGHTRLKNINQTIIANIAIRLG